MPVLEPALEPEQDFEFAAELFAVSSANAAGEASAIVTDVAGSVGVVTSFEQVAGVSLVALSDLDPASVVVVAAAASVVAAIAPGAVGLESGPGAVAAAGPVVGPAAHESGPVAELAAVVVAAAIVAAVELATGLVAALVVVAVAVADLPRLLRLPRECAPVPYRHCNLRVPLALSNFPRPFSKAPWLVGVVRQWQWRPRCCCQSFFSETLG